MILSKVMQESDYDQLVAEGMVLTAVHDAIQMWNPHQHHARLWEYTLALKALKTVFGNKKDLLVSDHGCGSGYLSPMLYWLGHRVKMYERWTFGFDEEPYMLEQMQRVARTKPVNGGWYEMHHRLLGELILEDNGVDAAFCVSTLEHVKDYEVAFCDLLRTVKPGGLAFITTDFGEHELDDYACAPLRAGKMFTSKTYFDLLSIAEAAGFDLVPDDNEPIQKSNGKNSVTTADWEWKEECRLVMGYGFASMALVRETWTDRMLGPDENLREVAMDEDRADNRSSWPGR